MQETQTRWHGSVLVQDKDPDLMAVLPDSRDSSTVMIGLGARTSKRSFADFWIWPATIGPDGTIQ